MSGIDALRAGFGGTVFTPDHPGYEQARAIWNGAIDKRPSVVARCASARDAAAAVRWAREGDVEIAVRAGGHGVSGNALTEGGIVIDLSAMTGVEVDPVRGVARVEPGVLLGDLTRATQVHGLAVPSGIVSHTGVAGLTLGGGIGWLMRKHGLSCDNLIGADVVTAAGTTVRASEDDDPELLWGLRGGGGNFGVVTSFEFRCHAVGPQVLAGPMLWDAEHGEELLAFYRDFAHAAPRELTTVMLLRLAPPAPWVPAELHGRPVVVIAFCYAGDPATGERVIEPMRRWGVPLLDAVGMRDFTDYHYLFDGSVPHGQGYYWKSQYLRDLTPGAVGSLTGQAWKAESPRSYTIVFQLGGAVADVEPDATAFEDRTAAFTPNINAVWPDPADPMDVEWARALFDSLEPASTGRAYVNFMSNDEQDRVASAYGESKLARLVALKDRLDPQNAFHLNQNIAPSR